MTTWNAEIIQMIKIAADVVGERQDIYISIFATDDNINVTVYPWETGEPISLVEEGVEKQEG